MQRTPLLLALLFLFSCGEKSQKRSERIVLSETGQTSLIILGAKSTPEFLQQARELGVEVEGEGILRLTGDATQIGLLDVPTEEQNLAYLVDAPIEVERPAAGNVDSRSLYQAKADFGLLKFWKKNKSADGRGVIVGVLDDGISPNQSAFVRTTDGKRKFLLKGGNSTLTTFDLVASDEGFTAQIEERKSFSGQQDINADGTFDSWKASVSADGRRVCLDLNLDQVFSEEECRGTFSQSGEYFILPKAPTQSILAEVDLEEKKLRLIPSEYSSHGEGVAAVMAGHGIGNIQGFDGVAPGAQIIDYDLSEPTHLPEENEYTMGKILLGLDWMAKNGAEVLNVSYSLFFTHTQSQTFMARALQSLVDKYNVVISFSAGNNGPGLGSLNRRLIYPPSVLVAGAYVSKELDERVHGVTGIPEEGRVVYYSSRGPGAGGVGPMLISPLSSLTPNSSNAGFMAFNGTSSASPALAGAAAVLISAIKQEGLKVDAATIVHALRLSGRQLKMEPFISQGYGLPQVGKALDIYRELITGKNFLYLNHVVNRGGLDSTSAEGIILKKSESAAVESFRISLKGVLSKLAPADATTNFLVPLEISYTNGISGARELWASVSDSRFYVDVNIDEVLNGAPEAFGEIRLHSKLDKSLLAVIPVTAINDVRVNNLFRSTMTVSSQEGDRLHFHVPSDVQALKVKFRVLEGERRYLSISAYDPDFVRVKSSAPNEFLLVTPKPGHYQITLHMVGGTKRQGKVEVEVEEVQVSLDSTLIMADRGRVTLTNHSSSPLSGEIVLGAKPTVLKTLVFNNRNSAPEIELTVGKGTYSAELRPTAQYDLSYFYANCSIRQKTEEGIIPHSSGTFKITGEETATLIFRCVPFDYGIEPVDTLLWQLRVLSRVDEVKLRIDIPAYSKKTFIMPQLTAGEYQVEFGNPLSGDRIKLGNLELY